MSFHCCCITWMRFSRTLLPEFVLTSNDIRTPPLARMPSDPFAHPASSNSFSAAALSNGYLGLTLGLYAQVVGGSTESAGTAWPKLTAFAIEVRSSAVCSALRTILSPKIFDDGLLGSRLNW